MPTIQLNLFGQLLTLADVVNDPMAPLEATWRFPVAQAEEFDHRGNPAHIVVERDPMLGRDIVNLKNVYWLSFRKRFGPHTPGEKNIKIAYLF